MGGQVQIPVFHPDIYISLDPVEISFRYQLLKCSERTGFYQSIIQYEALTSIFTKLYSGMRIINIWTYIEHSYLSNSSPTGTARRARGNTAR